MPSTRPPVRGQTLASRLIQRVADGAARRDGFAAGDARRREVRLNRAAANSEHGAQMRWPTSQATGDGMRRYMADRGRTQRAAANREGAAASRASARSRRAARR